MQNKPKIRDDGILSPKERAQMAKEDAWYAADKPIGFLACFEGFDAQGPFWCVARMGADRKYWNKNIADTMLAELYNCAKERGVERIRFTYYLRPACFARIHIHL